MRTTINLDDQLLAKARKYTGIELNSALVHEALTALIQREAARRLALLGGTKPDMKDIPRRQREPSK
jgi:Arc/MetJ family transcription regulator